MPRASKILLLLLPLLACAKPAPAVDPEGDATQAERADAQANAEAQARRERLGAWVSDNVAGERYLVPIAPDDLSFGAGPEARVTFVVFLDYQCPFSRKLNQELHALVEAHPADVRVVVKHLPLPMHERASLAAEFVLAAASAGQGLAMHELLFANQTQLDDDALDRVVREAQLSDPDRFWRELQQGTYTPRVAQDMTLATTLGVRSTPSFFVNGVPQRGFKTLEQLSALYVDALEVADRIVAAGATPPEVYDLLMTSAAPTREPPARPPAEGLRPGSPDPAVNYAVPVDDRPTRGRDDALVTIIEFADFECPYSRKVQATLRELEARYPDELRIVYRHQPLPMHASAMPAALAAAAAERQGEFWAMHDALFASSADQLADPNHVIDLAKGLGLDIRKFRADLRDPKLAKRVDADQKLAKQFGATGTPAFFINGRHLSGALPAAIFAALIDEERDKAKAYARAHQIAPEQLYATMTKGWVTEVEQPPIADHTRRALEVRDLPGKGKLSKAAITMVMCGDFDCPHTAKGAALVTQILADPGYRKQVGFYFMHFPGPAHPEAMGAHQAAIAAGEQGKFWEMHDLLFADRARRGRDEYAAMAAELDLDVEQFLADWSSQTTLDTIAANKETCTKLGTSGTPHFFINGRAMRGARPFDEVREVLDEELAGGFEAAAKKQKED